MSKNNKTAMEAASDYLGPRMRTEYEVRRRLAEREYEAAEIDETVTELRRLGYINDTEYAARYFEYNRDKKRGSKRAARELAEKGVMESVIKNVREDFLYENKVDEFEDARTLAAKMIENRDVDERLKAKIARTLENRGFSNGDIIRVLGTLGGIEIKDE